MTQQSEEERLQRLHERRVDCDAVGGVGYNTRHLLEINERTPQTHESLAFLDVDILDTTVPMHLVIEFTNQGPALLVPTLLCVAGAVTVTYLLARRRVTGVA